jgi:predicted transposase YbfD/YdcC
VGTLPVAHREEVKRTNEIKTAIPLLEAIDIKGKEGSADALLTQRRFATYLVEERHAHYHFTVKGNQPGLLEALEFYFQERGQPHFVEHTPPDHGRLETRKIWTTTELNGYLDFPHVGQAFVIERHVTEKKTGATSREIAYGLTSRPPAQADPARAVNRPMSKHNLFIELLRKRVTGYSMSGRDSSAPEGQWMLIRANF